MIRVFNSSGEGKRGMSDCKSMDNYDFVISSRMSNNSQRIHRHGHRSLESNHSFRSNSLMNSLVVSGDSEAPRWAAQTGSLGDTALPRRLFSNRAILIRIAETIHPFRTASPRNNDVTPYTPSPWSQ